LKLNGLRRQKLSEYLTQTFMTHCNEMIYQQVALSGYAEWPKAADAVIEAKIADAIRACPGGSWAGDGDPGKVLSPVLFFCLSYAAARDVSTLSPYAKANKKSTVIPTLRWSMPD
jgi:hypothetical protein